MGRKRSSLPHFVPKHKRQKENYMSISSKKQQRILVKHKKIDIARAQGYATEEILPYHCVECPLFKDENLAKHSKHELLNLLGKFLYT